MSRNPTQGEIQDIFAVIALLPSGTEVVSRNKILDYITEEPNCYPALWRLSTAIQLDVITRVMNQHYPLRNQTAHRPKARVWDLTSPKMEVSHAIC